MKILKKQNQPATLLVVSHILESWLTLGIQLKDLYFQWLICLNFSPLEKPSVRGKCLPYFFRNITEIGLLKFLNSKLKRKRGGRN